MIAAQHQRQRALGQRPGRQSEQRLADSRDLDDVFLARVGGVFLAHNVVNKAKDMEPFLATIQGNPAVFTSIVSPGSEGMSVSYKLR